MYWAILDKLIYTGSSPLNVSFIGLFQAPAVIKELHYDCDSSEGMDADNFKDQFKWAFNTIGNK